MSTLMQRLMALRFAKPAAAPEKAAKAPGWRAERSAAIAEGQLRRNAPTLTEGRALVSAARGDPASLSYVGHESHARPPASVVPAPAVPTSARGSCKAVNAATGIQCALPAGHPAAHRHGRTDFTRLAVPGERFNRREQLESYATASTGSPFSGE